MIHIPVKEWILILEAWESTVRYEYGAFLAVYI
jgi:hypothetical protein